MSRRGGYDDDDDDDMLLKALQMSEPCGNCGKQGAQIPCMSGCGEVYYCSRECNMLHASSHRLRCQNLRCPKFNDDESEEDSSDESYDDSSEESDDDDEPPPPPAAKGGKGGNGGGKLAASKSDGGGGKKNGSSNRIRVDSDVERRIEEKIMRRLKKQEENRIAQAIEAQMAMTNANWTDEDMNRIAMEVKNRLQKEMGHMFMNGSSRSRKNSITRESLLSARQINRIAEEEPGDLGSSRGKGTTSKSAQAAAPERSVTREVSRQPSSRSRQDAPPTGSLPRTGSKESMVPSNGKTSGTSSSRNIAIDVAPAAAIAAKAISRSSPSPPKEKTVTATGSNRSLQVDTAVAATAGSSAATPTSGPPPAWNNKCAAFLSLKIVVWKLDFLPQLKFGANEIDGTWNRVVEIDADESFSHIVAGDMLMSLNGQHLTGVAMDEETVLEMLQMAHGSHLILKFSTAEPVNKYVREYSVKWGNGPLGLTLKDDGSPEALPIVHRLTKKPGSVAVKENIAIGDVLCSINNIDTVQLGCALTMSVLKKVQLPAVLTFRGVGGGGSSKEESASAPHVTVSRETKPVLRQQTSTSSGVYTVNWAEGPLGLTIIPGLAAGDLPVIKRVTGKGESAGIDSAQVGDCLLTVSGKNAGSMSFESIVDMMKTLPKPILLEFRSGKKSTRSVPAAPAPPAAVVEAPRRDPTSRAVAPPAPVVKPQEAVRTKTPTSSRTLPVLDKGEIDIDLPVSGGSSPSTFYSIVWGEGPLGLTIDSIPHATGAFIKRSSGAGAAAHLSEDCIGDEMTHINDIDVTQMDYTRIVSYLKKVPRPVTLRFKKDTIVGRDSVVAAPSRNSGGGNASNRNMRPDSSTSVASVLRTDSSNGGGGMRQESSTTVVASSSRYELTWTEGSLGLSLHAADDKCEYPYITRVTGVGCAAHLPSSVAGDTLRYINGNSCHTSRMTFNDIMDMLKTLPKPIQLRFQKSGDDVPSSASSRGPAPRSNSGGVSTQPAANGNGAVNGGPSLGNNVGIGNGSFNTGGGDDDPTSSSHNMLTPFAGAPKLSSGRRQKIVKQLKK
ncbi:Aste57867_11195 [Aphanomyces stellatus]|uniref:Aste57867_11195 protein n=1 Tax=Aphanomyces stellatus TaxID=120398 RepID=A0A485KSZ5_9STRA|nr:hypothetical protein As57867_011153 [Aphanomyces stellatus]VFT88062.1 Aste57867_11195 [Aphanomyces stellatus]